MAPSKESEALAELFKTFGTKFPEDGDSYLSRAVYDQIHTAAAEGAGVSYEDVTAGGRPGLWIKPEGASKNHVVLYMHGG